MKFISAVFATASLLVSSLAAEAGKVVYINYSSGSSGSPRSAESIRIMNDDGTDHQTILNDGKWYGFAVLSHDSQYIAFLSHDANRKVQIYTANVDGTNIRQLTNFPDGVWGPSWSPNGKKIAFMAYPGADFLPGIFTINVDGTGLNRVVNLNNGQPAIWSPDGKKLLFADTTVMEYASEFELYTVAPDGSNLRQVTPLVYLRGWSWSPEGRVCYSYRIGSLSKIALLDTDGSNYTEIAASTEKRFEGCSFIENGRVLFSSPDPTDQSYFPSQSTIYSLKPNSINPYALDLIPLTPPSSGSNYAVWSTFNSAPIVENQDVLIDEDTVTKFVLNATDVNDDSLEYSIVSSPQHGTLSGTGVNLNYTPVANFNGSDSFSYTVSDGKLTSKPATVSINIKPVNDAPVAQDSTHKFYEDYPFHIRPSATDVDKDPLSFVMTTPPSNGQITVDAHGFWVYRPKANFNGSDSLQFKAFDGALYSEAATVTLQVKAENDAPIATSQNVSTNEDQSRNITLSATDVDSTELTYTIVSQPMNGILTGIGASLVYKPNKNYNGKDSFTFRASDGELSSQIETVALSIAAVDDAPVGTADSYVLNTKVKKAPKQLTVLAPGVLSNDFDVEGSPLTAVLVTKPTTGKLTFSTNGSFIYKPANEKKATYTFTYRVSDGKLQSEPVTVTIAVNP